MANAHVLDIQITEFNAAFLFWVAKNCNPEYERKHGLKYYKHYITSVSNLLNKGYMKKHDGLEPPFTLTPAGEKIVEILKINRVRIRL